MTSIRRGAAGAAILTVALLTACSTSKSTDGHRADDPTVAQHTATPADLRKTLLMSGDLPAQWKAVPHDSSDDNDPDDDKRDALIDAELATCIGIPKREITAHDDSDKDKVYSPDFTLEQSTVSSESEPNDSTFGAALARAVLTSQKTQGCLQTAFRKGVATGLPDGVSITKLDVKIVEPGADAPKNAQYEFEAGIDLAGGGNKLSLYLDFIDLQSDTVEANVNLQGFGKPVPASIRSAALAAVSKRVDAA